MKRELERIEGWQDRLKCRGGAVDAALFRPLRYAPVES